MVVILYHTTYRNIQMQFIQHFQCYINLSPSTIHKDQIRKNGKAVVFTLGFMGKAPCKHLFHAGIIIWSLHPFDLEFAVIAALRLALFVNYHGANGLKSTDIGNIVSFHPHHIFQAQPFLHFVNSTDRTAFFSFNPLSVL